MSNYRMKKYETQIRRLIFCMRYRHSFFLYPPGGPHLGQGSTDFQVLENQLRKAEKGSPCAFRIIGGEFGEMILLAEEKKMIINNLNRESALLAYRRNNYGIL